MIRFGALTFAVCAAAFPALVSAQTGGSVLTDAEIAAFARRVQACWKAPASNDASAADVTLRFEINPDAMPDPASFRIVGDADAASQRTFEAARAAIMRCAGTATRCHPNTMICGRKSR